MSASKRPRSEGDANELNGDEGENNSTAALPEDSEQQEQQHAGGWTRQDPNGHASAGAHSAEAAGSQQDNANEEGRRWLHTVVEDLLDVDIKQELRTNFYPRIKDISTAVEAMQYEAANVTEGARVERESLDRELNRLAGLVASFQLHVSQLLPPVDPAAAAAAADVDTANASAADEAGVPAGHQ